MVTEKEYLDMANHCKELIERKDNQIYKLKSVILDTHKAVSQIYGNIRNLDEFLENNIEELKDNKIIEYLIEKIRSISSDILFYDIENEHLIYNTFNLNIELAFNDLLSSVSTNSTEDNDDIELSNINTSNSSVVSASL